MAAKKKEIPKIIIPKNWGEVTHRQFFCLRKIVSHDLTTNFDTLYDLTNCLSNLPENEILALPMSELEALAPAFDFLETEIFHGEISNFEHEGKVYEVDNFMNQWLIKLILNNTYGFDTAKFHEQILADDLSGLPLLLALWASGGETDFDHGEVEKRAERFNTLGVSVLLGVYAFYCSQMQNIAKYFKDLFKKSYIKNADYYAHILEKYGWECSVSELAAGDIAKKTSIYMSTIFDALQELEMRKLNTLATQKLQETQNNA